MRTRLALVISFLAAVAVAGAIWPVARSDRPQLDRAFRPPSAVHWMGTDHLGRDLWGRTIRATSTSLIISVITWSCALVLGFVVGAHAGLLGRSMFDRAIVWLLALLYSTPFIVVLVGVLAVAGAGLLKAHLLIFLFAWAPAARYVRTLVLQLRSRAFVVAAMAVGYQPPQILRYAVFPQIYRPTIAAALPMLPEIMAIDAALSFFGLGLPPPTPTLGRLIMDGTGYVSIAWWMAFFPIAGLSAICLAVRWLSHEVEP